MNRKQKNQLWRIPSFLTFFIALIYELIQLIVGQFPAISRIQISEDTGLYSLGNIIFKLPVPVSRDWDLIFVFILILLLVINYQNKDEEKDSVDIHYYSFFAVCAIISIPITYAVGIKFDLLLSFFLPIPISVLYSKNARIKYALILGLGFTLIHGFVFGLLSLSVFLGVCLIIYSIGVIAKNDGTLKFVQWLSGGDAYKKPYKMQITKAKKNK